MTDIPLHRVLLETESGIRARILSPRSERRPVDYLHRDDYYLFGAVASGSCRVMLDFREYALVAGDALCVMPQQVHRVVDAGDATLLLLLVDGTFVDEHTERLLAEYALVPARCPIDAGRFDELQRLFPMILRRTDAEPCPASQSVLRHLVSAFVGLLAESIRTLVGTRMPNGRHAELALEFRRLLVACDPVNREVGHYAAALHLSPVYLNEVIRSVTGMSVGRCIREELILRAKRLLVHTSASVQEVAARVGVEDAAYFTRLFTRAVGMSPTAFRRKYLE